MCIICRKEYDVNTTEIDCDCCKKVTEIPILPNLQKLYCWNTNITEIPILPNLQTLGCENTKITEISILPNLQTLGCENTKITEIPILPNLQILNCYNTKITEIPILPNLQVLGCSNTKITEIPILPNLQTLYCYNCPWLERSYENKEDFQKQMEKLKIVQKCWREQRWEKISACIPLILNEDVKQYILKPYLVY